MPERISRSSRRDWPLRCLEDDVKLNRRQWHRDAPDSIPACPNASITTVPERISRSSRRDRPLRCLEDEVKLKRRQWHRDVPVSIPANPNTNITTAPEKISRSSRRDWPLRCHEDEVKLNVGSGTVMSQCQLLGRQVLTEPRHWNPLGESQQPDHQSLKLTHWALTTRHPNQKLWSEPGNQALRLTHPRC